MTRVLIVENSLGCAHRSEPMLPDSGLGCLRPMVVGDLAQADEARRLARPEGL